MVNTASFNPGKLSLAAKANAVSCATEELVLVVVAAEWVHAAITQHRKGSIISQNRFISQKKLFFSIVCLQICNIFCNFAAFFTIILFMSFLFSSQWLDLKRLLPWEEVSREKKSMRAILEQRRRVLSKEDVATNSEAIVSQIEQTEAFRSASVVMVYYPIHNEVDLLPLVRKYSSEKTFIFPVTHRHSIELRPFDGEENMRRGRFGVPEPQTDTWEDTVDLILVPGVAFDTHMHRIGRGGGYYDRFLRKQHKAIKMGVAYDFQLKKKTIPHNIWDVCVDHIVTPTQIV